jgi:glycosyltransferase involved in cell wall biosynthesis
MSSWLNCAERRPVVSVIVPARNEETVLGTCLESLVAQEGVPFEAIVVDDGSTDGTRNVAQSFAGVEVVDSPPLPAGWGGKNNAALAGARRSRGDWLLFTDADTVHLPGSLARALGEAKQHAADLVSYSPQQEVHGFWEKAVMPVIFAQLASTYRPAQVSDPASPVAAANGQYLLITREAYDAVGGHAAVATSLLEDVALARAVKQSGRRIFFRYGGDAVRTRMYRNFAQLREGWTKNLALLFPSPRQLAVLLSLEFVLIVASGGIAIFEAVRGRPAVGFWWSWLFLGLLALLWVRVQKAHFPPGTNPYVLFGLPVFAYLLVRSKHLHQKGSVAWKGRMYGPAAPAIRNAAVSGANLEELRRSMPDDGG